jgi:hypothetical protein
MNDSLSNRTIYRCDLTARERGAVIRFLERKPITGDTALLSGLMAKLATESVRIDPIEKKPA